MNDADGDDRSGKPTVAEENAEATATMSALRQKNHALASALARAGKELSKAKAQLAQIAKPVLTFATMMRLDAVHTDADGVRHASAEVLSGSRRCIVPVAPNVDAARLKAGNTVVLNEHLVLVEQRGTHSTGSIRVVRQVLDDGRLVVDDGSGNAQVVRRSAAMANAVLTKTDRVLVATGAGLALEMLPDEEDTDLVLEETPDVSFRDIGGLDAQIERIRDAVQLPFEHRGLFARYALKAPKGLLLYGPPGNGKTLIAKAVAHELSGGGDASHGVFLSVKGPELLNKYVGESERLIRLIFTRARERAATGNPVIVFIDEMDSLLRTRGSGISSDVETTIVPQFLSELDGIEQLENVMVIGASNRIDMIDPAVLRPGRLDVKIRVDRPDAAQAGQILAHYVNDELPLESGAQAGTLIDSLVSDVYSRDERRHLCDVADESGRWSPLYLADVVSGAMLKNMVDRAKTMAVKASIRSGVEVAMSSKFCTDAVDDEFSETRDAVLDADPVQWSRINALTHTHTTDATNAVITRIRAADPQTVNRVTP